MSDPDAERIARRDRRRERQRERIRETARELLAEDGVRDLTATAIANRADVSKAAFYYYFDSLDALISDLAAETIELESKQACDALLRANTAEEAVSESLRAIVGFYAADLSRFRVAHLWPQVAGLQDPGVLRDRIYPASDRFVSTLAESLVRSGKMGDGFDPRRFANLVWMTATGIIHTFSGMERMGGSMRYSLDDLVAEAQARLVGSLPDEK